MGLQDVFKTLVSWYFFQDFDAVCVFETSTCCWDGLYPSAILGARQFLQAVCILKGTSRCFWSKVVGLHHMEIAWSEKHGLCSGLAFGISLRVLNHFGALVFWALSGASPLASPSLRPLTSSNCWSCYIAMRWKISLKPGHFGSVWPSSMPFVGEPPTFAPKLGLMPWSKLKCHKLRQFSNLYVPGLLHDLSCVSCKGSDKLQWGWYDINQVVQDTYSCIIYIYT